MGNKNQFLSRILSLLVYKLACEYCNIFPTYFTCLFRLTIWGYDTNFVKLSEGNLFFLKWTKRWFNIMDKLLNRLLSVGIFFILYWSVLHYILVRRSKRVIWPDCAPLLLPPQPKKLKNKRTSCIISSGFPEKIELLWRHYRWNVSLVGQYLFWW